MLPSSIARSLLVDITSAVICTRNAPMRPCAALLRNSTQDGLDIAEAESRSAAVNAAAARYTRPNRPVECVLRNAELHACRHAQVLFRRARERHGSRDERIRLQTRRNPSADTQKPPQFNSRLVQQLQFKALKGPRSLSWFGASTWLQRKADS